MKKAIYFLMIFIGLTSCSQDIAFNNNAAFQGVKDNVSWKAADSKAIIDIENKSISIEAINYNESLTMTMPLPDTFVNQKNKSTHKTYSLGIDNKANVTYFQSLNEVQTDYEADFGIGDGEIVITDYDGFTISGTYRFNLKNTDTASEEPETVNFQYGNFYKVPIIR